MLGNGPGMRCTYTSSHRTDFLKNAGLELGPQNPSPFPEQDLASLPFPHHATVDALDTDQSQKAGTLQIKAEFWNGTTSIELQLHTTAYAGAKFCPRIQPLGSARLHRGNRGQNLTHCFYNRKEETESGVSL